MQSLRSAAAAPTIPRLRHWCDVGLGLATTEYARGDRLLRAVRTTESWRRYLANQSQRARPPPLSPNAPPRTNSPRASIVLRRPPQAAAQSDSSGGLTSPPNTPCS